MGFSIKLKTKTGQHVVRDLEKTSTIGNLKSKIEELTNISPQALQAKLGFPPKPLDLSNESIDIASIGISNGDTLIVEERGITQEEREALERLKQMEEDERLAREIADENSGILLKQIVPADNSCLFTSIGFCLSGKVNTDQGMMMRELIASSVHNDKPQYNEGILGRPNDEYCAWILQPESWGGAIEVSILSKYYGMEIDVVDITNAIINKFGEDQCYGNRIFLLFDGIHYDPLYMESTSGGQPPKTIFPTDDENVYLQAQQIANEAKSSRQFTDVNKFTLRCNDCDMFLKGQEEAQKHATATGHLNFGEV